MEIFSVLLAICAGNSPVSGEFPAQRPATRSFDVFFDLCLNKRLGKQLRGWWFETLYCPLWRHCNGFRSTFAQVMACYLRASVHNLNRCCVIMKGVPWHSPEGSFIKGAHKTESETFVWRLHHYKGAKELASHSTLKTGILELCYHWFR